MPDWQQFYDVRWNHDDTIVKVNHLCGWETEVWVPGLGLSGEFECRGCLTRFKVEKTPNWSRVFVAMKQEGPRCPHCGELLETD